MLRDLEDEGAVERKRGKRGRQGRRPAQHGGGRHRRPRPRRRTHRPSRRLGQRTERAPRREILIACRRASAAGPPAPGVGDRALVRIETARGDEPATRPIRAGSSSCWPRRAPRLLGVFRIEPRSGAARRAGRQEERLGRVSPCPRRSAAAREDGELVAVEPLGRAPRLRPAGGPGGGAARLGAAARRPSARSRS